MVLSIYLSTYILSQDCCTSMRHIYSSSGRLSLYYVRHNVCQQFSISLTLSFIPSSQSISLYNALLWFCAKWKDGESWRETARANIYLFWHLRLQHSKHKSATHTNTQTAVNRNLIFLFHHHKTQKDKWDIKKVQNRSNEKPNYLLLLWLSLDDNHASVIMLMSFFNT